MSRSSRNTLKLEKVETNNYDAYHDPEPTDDTRKSYDIGSIRINVKTNSAFICTDNSRNSAVWKSITENQDSKVKELEDRISFLESVIFNLTGLSKPV